jgi:hypothetical protein
MDEHMDPTPSKFGEDLPSYDRSEMNFTPSNGHAESSSQAPPSESSRFAPDKRAIYALRLQKACDFAWLRVKNNHVIANSNWASPLATAPSAISTMAILLKAANQRAAAGLEIETQEVQDGDGVVRGTLP